MTTKQGVAELITCDFLLRVVIVARSEQVTKDHGWHKHVVFLVHDHWYTTTIVPDLDLVVGPESTERKAL